MLHHARFASLATLALLATAVGPAGTALAQGADNCADAAALKSFRNLADVQVVTTGELNAYDVLCNEWIVFSKATLPAAPTAKEAAQ